MLKWNIGLLLVLHIYILYFGVNMKSVRQIIKDMVDKYPNDMELGAKIRWYIHWLYNENEKKEYKDKNKWSA